MCGRSSLSKTEKEIEDRFGATFYSDELERYNPLPNYNVAPTHYHPVITNEEMDRIHLFNWGLVPFWAKDRKIAYKMINARVETLAEKASFKHALKSRRCLVPMDGFYEWKKEEKGKTPFRIKTKDEEIFSVAGLWEVWKDPQNGETLYSFTVITQPANAVLKDIHDRMPAILPKDQEQLWLDNSLSTDELISLIEPYPDELIDFYPVSKEVGNVKNNHKGLIEPIHKTPQQGSLF
jgi:putative SOS response-associated peptidase YedK